MISVNMIGIFQRTVRDEKIKAIEEFRSGSWIYVESPSDEEVAELARDFSLSADLLRDGTDPYEVPRMETEGGAIYLFARTPYKGDDEVTTVPLLIVIGADFFITLSKERHPFFRKMVSGGADFHTSQKTAMLTLVFSEILSLYNESLTSIRRQVRIASGRVEDISNNDISKFLLFEGVINDFLAALIPTNAILSNLLSGKAPKELIKLYDADHDLIEDLFLGSAQTIELSKSSLKTIVNIREAYSTIMTNNLNRTMKLLTALTVILTIPTFISGFFGMNVRVPLADFSYGFWAIVFFSIVVSGATLYFFLKKKWF